MIFVINIVGFELVIRKTFADITPSLKTNVFLDILKTIIILFSYANIPTPGNFQLSFHRALNLFSIFPLPF